jgi:5-methylcytosine-specific restriction endonuclease McrA
MTKRCTVCGIEQPIDQFRRATCGAFGRAGRCKKCDAPVMAEYRRKNRRTINRRYRERYALNPAPKRASVKAWIAANSDKAKSSVKKWRMANPDYCSPKHADQDQRRAAQRAWYAAHRDAQRARNRARMKKNRNLVAEREKRRSWKLAHPDEARAQHRKHRHIRRARALDQFVEAVDPIVLFRRDKGRCKICKRRIANGEEWHIDHYVPLSKRGIHGYDNVRVACSSCNLRKHAAMPTGQVSLFQVKPS